MCHGWSDLPSYGCRGNSGWCGNGRQTHDAKSREELLRHIAEMLMTRATTGQPTVGVEVPGSSPVTPTTAACLPARFFSFVCDVGDELYEGLAFFGHGIRLVVSEHDIVE